MIECRLREVESITSDPKYTEMDDDLAETENGWLNISRWYVQIPELALVLRKGIICVWAEEPGMYLPDQAVTVIGDVENDMEADYVNAGFAEAISVWYDDRFSISEAEELKCRIEYPTD